MGFKYILSPKPNMLRILFMHKKDAHQLQQQKMIKLASDYCSITKSNFLILLRLVTNIDLLNTSLLGGNRSVLHSLVKRVNVRGSTKKQMLHLAPGYKTVIHS